MKGENQETFDELPQYLYEHLLAKHYGWSLSDIRNLDMYDFWVHVRLCLVADAVEKEFHVRSMGGGSKKKQPVKKGGGPAVKKIYQRFDPNTGRLLGENE